MYHALHTVLQYVPLHPLQVSPRRAVPTTAAALSRSRVGTFGLILWATRESLCDIVTPRWSGLHPRLSGQIGPLSIGRWIPPCAPWQDEIEWVPRLNRLNPVPQTGDFDGGCAVSSSRSPRTWRPSVGSSGAIFYSHFVVFTAFNQASTVVREGKDSERQATGNQLCKRTRLF